MIDFFHDLDKIISHAVRDSMAFLNEDLSSEKIAQNKQSQEISSRGLTAKKKKPEREDETDEDEDDEITTKNHIDKEDKIVSKTIDKSKKGEKQQLFPGKSDDDTSTTRSKGTADSPNLKSPTKELASNPTLDTLIGKINVLRGGKSLKDEETRAKMSDYFKGLSHEDRSALVIYLAGLSQILAGVASPEDAVKPKDYGIATKMLGKQSDKVPHSKKEKEHEPKDIGRETSSGVDKPIVVGESQNKSKIKSMLESYRSK